MRTAAKEPSGNVPVDVRAARLPSVEAVLGGEGGAALKEFSRPAVLDAARRALAGLRERLRSGEELADSELTAAAVASIAERMLALSSAPALTRVINATGVVLHTNIGRAVLCDAAIEAAALAAGASVNLEYDLATGGRGDRDLLVEEHLCALTGAEAATVVNNNAAGVLLALHTLAASREVVVSRGELVEIGGSFRIPEIMKASGAVLREVGTTNRTHPADYRDAIGADTALLMKVHASNYRIVGFASSVDLAELSKLAKQHAGIVVVEDLGSGAVVDLSALGLAPEPTIAASLRAGADLVLASGDKLLGGPQCGIVAGRRDIVERLRRSPLKRAVRCDKMTLAALEATLRVYRFSPRPEQEIPTLRYLRRGLEELRRVGEEALGLLGARLGPRWAFELVESRAETGSGSQPNVAIASLAIAVAADGLTAAAIEQRFRASQPPILGRIHDDRFVLDLRTIDDPHDLVPHWPRPDANWADQ
ncbi:MAG TPA: L-seryl-tRNA(Sec) selenium transferase [Candidatus Binatia bacterium]|jgi:L-seryl-tRNA(Ser) seleniumtransferase